MRISDWSSDVCSSDLAAVWPDCVKKLGDRLKATFVWHYQDVNICAPFALPPECAEGNCVSAQITRDMATLRDRHAARIDRLKALVFLIHFVGDQIGRASCRERVCQYV